MEEIDLTDGQFRILLNMTANPDDYTKPVAHLVGALHKADRRGGNKWRVRLTEQDITTALDLFEVHKTAVRTPHAQQALANFVRGSLTAQEVYHGRHPQADVPRETSEGSDG